MKYRLKKNKGGNKNINKNTTKYGQSGLTAQKINKIIIKAFSNIKSG